MRLLLERADMRVVRRLHKLPKPNRPCCAPQGTSRCFCCFCGKLSAVGISYPAEILGRRRFGERKNSGGVRCYVAVLPLFWSEQIHEPQKGHYRRRHRSSRRVLDSAYPLPYHSKGSLSI